MVPLLAIASCNGLLGIEEATELSADASFGGSVSGGTGGVGVGGSAGTSTGGLGGGPSGGGSAGATGGSAGVSDAGDAASDAPVDASCGANLQTDAANCGSCGHDCLGGQCALGKCQPVKLGDIPYGANELALGPSDVFVASGYGWALHKVPKAGGIVGTWSTDSALVQISEHAGTMYFNEYGAYTIYQVPAQGVLVPTDFYYGTAVIDSFEVDASGVYFAQCPGLSTGILRHLPLSGGSSPTALTGTTSCPEQIVLDASNIYFTSPYTPPRLYKVPKVGGTVAELTTTSDYTWAIAIDGTKLYYSTVDGAVYEIGTNGSGKVPLAGGLQGPGQLLVDAGYLYVSTRGSDGQNYADGAIYRLPLGVSPPTLEPVLQNVAQPTGMAADATALYWSTRGVAPNGQGGIWKLAK